jgi:hypothetical protein
VSSGTGIGDTRVKVENIRNEKSAEMRDTRVRCRSEETKIRGAGTGEVDKLQKKET